MPHAVSVLDHWIEPYSADRDETATADHRAAAPPPRVHTGRAKWYDVIRILALK
jgi:hypothetical protein